MKKKYWVVSLCAGALLSGCLSQEVQNALLRQSMPYGLNSALTSPYGVPQRGYTSANTQAPQRSYSSRTTASAAGWGAAGTGWVAAGGNTQGLACMQNIDQAELRRISDEAQRMDAEVKSLCAQGKRDKAMSAAMAFGKKMASSKVMQDMKKCGDTSRQMMPPIATQHDKPTRRHICDG